MADIIRNGVFSIRVPVGLPLLVCEVVAGQLVRAWPGKLDKEMISWEAFNRLPLNLRGTAFQRQVWQALLTLRPGELISYGELACRIGRPKASRAVGQAVGANPILWRIPCHRVVRSDGRLGGFSGGLAVKRAFLEYENIVISENSDIVLSFENKRLREA